MTRFGEGLAGYRRLRQIAKVVARASGEHSHCTRQIMSDLFEQFEFSLSGNPSFCCYPVAQDSFRQEVRKPPRQA